MTAREAGSGFDGMRAAVSVSRVVDSSRARAAAPGGMDYDPPTCTGVTKDEAPCTAKRAKSTLFCAGHLRQRGELD